MILVTGPTGSVGREVVNLLLSGGEQVVAVTRNPAKAALPDGAHVVGGERAFCRAFPAQREITVPGLHFLQEDAPDEIGIALASWLHTLA